MAYRALEFEGRVLSCQAKPSDNKWLQKNMPWFYISCTFFVCACKFLE